MFSKDNKVKEAKTMDINVIAKNTSFQGEIKADGDFRIDGNLEGFLETSGKVIIGVHGFIKGKVTAANSDIEGKFNGELLVSETLSIKATSQITGDVVVGKLSVEPGAMFNATCSTKGAVKELNSNEEKAQRERTA